MADFGSTIGGLLDGYGEWLNPTAASVPQGAAYDAETLRAARMALLGQMSGALLAAGQPGPIGQRAQMLAKIGDAPTAYNEALQGGVRMQAAKLAMDKARQEAADAERFRNTDLSTMGLSPQQATLLKALPADTRATVLGQLLTKDRSPGQIFGSDKSGYFLLGRDGKPVPLTPGAQRLPVPEEVATQEKQLRTEFFDRTKDFAPRQTAYRTMEELAKQGEGASDIMLLVSLFKVYDPTSTVTGQEAATAQNAGGVPIALQNVYNQVRGGGKLAQEMRDQLVNAGRQRYEREFDDYGKRLGEYTELSKQYGVEPSRVIKDARDPGKLKEMQLRIVPPVEILKMTEEQLLELPLERMSPAQQAAVRQRAMQLKQAGGGR